MRILIIRRDNIGDLVCTTPLFAALRARYPQARIEALVNSYNGGVLAGNPDLDAVHKYTKVKNRAANESALGPVIGPFEGLASKPCHWHPWQVPHEIVAADTPPVADIAVELVVRAWLRLEAGAAHQ